MSSFLSIRRSLSGCLALAVVAAGCERSGTGSDPEPVSTVTISLDSAVVFAGQTVQLSATARDSAGKALSGVTFSWSSSDPSVAAVSATGLVSGQKSGVTTITASAQGRSGSAQIRIPAPGLRVVSGAGAIDTVDAVQPQPLVVEVITAPGVPAQGTSVEFRSPEVAPAPDCTGSACPRGPSVAVGSGAQGTTFGGSAVVAVDAQGRASVPVKMGGVAGPGMVTAASLQHGFQDTARFTITPGAAVRGRVLPRDSALYVGASYALTAFTLDRYGNRRADPATLTAVDAKVAVEGSAVRGVAVGRSAVAAAWGGLADTAGVSVVPRGTLAAYRQILEGELAVFDLDGSGYRILTNGRVPGILCCDMVPDWSPDGGRLVYQNGYPGSPNLARLFTIDVPGAVRTRLITAASPLVGEQEPQFSADGAWIYFTGSTGGGSEVWRVRSDGSGPERVGPPAPPFRGMPSPSPDGTRLAYVALASNRFGIHVRELASGAVSVLDVNGFGPRWSPDGDLIAYVFGQGTQGPLWVVRPDGSGARRVTPEGTGYLEDFDWSPDGRYLVAHAGNRLHVVDAATGEAIPLPWTSDMRYPAWRP